MSEINYNKVFESIKINLVPKIQYEESQLELNYLKEELRKMKLKFEEQKLTIDIIQAEKDSLEAEKKTFEVKFKEVSLKLKQKIYLYESQKTTMNTLSNTECRIENISSGSQTVKLLNFILKHLIKLML